jgi:hypothetical protein
VVLALAEVLGPEELWQADNLRTVTCGLAHHLRSMVEIIRHGGNAGHLDQGDADGFSGHGSSNLIFQAGGCSDGAANHCLSRRHKNCPVPL